RSTSSAPIFSSLHRPPPTPTLFPYTTLFRSPPLASLRAFEAAARHLSFKKAALELGVTPTAVSHQIRLLEESCGQPLFQRRPRPDRKSTRLNSSHVSISYAVFCLKKKRGNVV